MRTQLRRLGRVAPLAIAVSAVVSGCGEQPKLPRGAQPTRPLPAQLSSANLAAAKSSTIGVGAQGCPSEPNQIAQGTGWAFAPDLFATAAHVVAGQTKIAIGTNTAALDGGNAEVVYFNPNIDLAVLRATTDWSSLPLQVAPMALANTATQTGEAVTDIGYPDGWALASSSGSGK